VALDEESKKIFLGGFVSLQGWRGLNVVCKRLCGDVIFDFLQGVYVLWYKLERTGSHFGDTPLFFWRRQGYETAHVTRSIEKKSVVMPGGVKPGLKPG
jgi:hypothetical protein